MTDLTPIVNDIREIHKQRDFFIGGRNKVSNMTGAYVRRYLGYDSGEDGNGVARQSQEVQSKIKKEAARLVNSIEKGDEVLTLPADVVAMVLTMADTKIPMQGHINKLTRALEQAAGHLPAALWVKSKQGFGMTNFGRIIGETGDLFLYETCAKVWKRMGLSVEQGRRQGAPGPNATTEDWIKHGYSKKRRAVVYNLGECLVKQGDDNPWRGLYLRKKSEFISSGKSERPLHANKHAKRVMTKQALKELWCVWNGKELITA